MKTRIKGAKGVIQCKTSSFEDATFMFDTKTLADWYPLDVNYEYRYNDSKELMYLIPLERSRESWDYGITSLTNRAISEVATFDLHTWYNKEVSEANKELMATAKLLGLWTLEDTYTMQHVEDNMDMLYELIEEPVHKGIEQRMLDKLTRKEYDSYRHKNMEQRGAIRIQHASPEDLTILAFSGKMRVMTNLMRQGVTE